VTPADAAAPGAWAVAAHEVRKRSLRSVKRALRPLWMRRLDARNLAGDAPLLSAAGPVVSLTTYEPRWHSVHYTIESIGAGRLRPSRLVLWVAPSVLTLGTPPALQRQIERGLELRTCEDWGPHKKYHPLVAAGPLGRPMVTADDDVLYGADWLEGLALAAASRPDFIHAHRAHVMSFDSEGRFLPYAQWPACRSTVPSALHFTTGVGGVLFPPAMQDALRRAGDGFRACCPRADDIWLNATAWRAGILVRQTQPFSPLLFEIPGTRTHGLAQGNRESGGNDMQLMQTYTADERARLFALARGQAR
jgi:hypothetical protein